MYVCMYVCMYVSTAANGGALGGNGEGFGVGGVLDKGVVGAASSGSDALGMPQIGP
jgi:hypothetical protein